MRLGVSSYTYTWAVGVPGCPPKQALDAPGLLHKAAALGIGCVQIADNLPLHLLSPEELKALGRRADAQGIMIEVGMRGLTPENLLTYLGLATELKSPILRVVVDAPGYHPHPDECVQIIKELLPELRRRGITLGVENHDRFTARTFADIINRTASDRVGICLDSVNSIGAGEGIETVVEILGPLTINLHVKDFIVKRVSHMMGFVIEGTPAGRGMLPVEWVLKKLEPYGRCESAILELWTSAEPEVAATIAKEDDWAIESVEYLRGLIPVPEHSEQSSIVRKAG